MGLTAKGEELLRCLEGRVAAEAEAKHAERIEAARSWARNKVSAIDGECFTAEFGATIELIDFSAAQFDEESDDALRLAALESELGVTFDRTTIAARSFAANGDHARDYFIAMELGAFLEFLRAHKQPS